jgi:uncharacterized NAD(P)/FAD-binding protein YdhS
VSTLETDLVIQATGLDTATAYTVDPLLARLLRDGLAAPDPLQLGLAAHPDGQLLDARGTPQPGLFALGSLLRGSLWECTAMPEIRVAAARLGARLTADGSRMPGHPAASGRFDPSRRGGPVPRRHAPGPILSNP